MMTFKIVRLIHLALYFLVAVQLTFYVYLMSDALKQISISAFIEQRKVVHPLVMERHQWVYYAVLALSFLLVIWSFKLGSTSTGLTLLIALLCVVADVIIGLKENGPLNTLIQESSITTQTIDWELVREKWLNMINIRGAIIIAGMLSLFSGLVFKK